MGERDWQLMGLLDLSIEDLLDDILALLDYNAVFGRIRYVNELLEYRFLLCFSI